MRGKGFTYPKSPRSVSPFWAEKVVQPTWTLAKSKKKTREGINTQPPQLLFPISYQGQDPGYFGISNFVDHGVNGETVDFNCGKRTYASHRGTNFYLWPYGWQKMADDSVWVVASAAGKISRKEDGHADQSCGVKDGRNLNLKWNMIEITHSDGSTTIYGHLKKHSLTPKVIGEHVEAGEFLGVVGSSGASTEPHLHFEVYDRNEHLVDPYCSGIII